MAHSPLQRLRTRSARPAVVVGLVVALCFAQWLGFLHGIAHAGTDRSGGFVTSPFDVAGAGTASASADVGGDQRVLATRHSCAAFDAATLGASAPSISIPLVAPGDAVPPPASPAAGPTLPDVRLAYLSRAPPAFTHA